jgi:hypothetical protein
MNLDRLALAMAMGPAFLLAQSALERRTMSASGNALIGSLIVIVVTVEISGLYDTNQSTVLAHLTDSETSITKDLVLVLTIQSDAVRGLKYHLTLHGL